MQQLLHRHVDRDPRAAPAHQLPCLAACAPQDPLTQPRHVAALLGQIDELRRRYRAERGVLPARQRFELAHAALLDVDDRLVVQVQRIGIHGFAQRHQQLIAIFHPVGPIGAKQAGHGAALQLGLARRQRREFDRGLGILGMCRDPGDTDAGTNALGGVLKRDRGSEFRDHRVGAGQHRRFISKITWLQYREFLVAPAPDAQRALAVLAQAARQHLQYLVADRMPLNGVDVAQVFDVDEQHRIRALRLGATDIGADLAQGGTEIAAAGKAGDRILADDLRGQRASQSGGGGDGLAIVLDRAFHRGMQFRRRAWLTQELQHLGFVDRGDGRSQVGLAGQQDASSMRRHGTRARQERGPVHARHAHVGDQHRDAILALQYLQCLGAAERGEHFIAPAELQAQALEHLGLVVHAQYLVARGVGQGAQFDRHG